VLDFWEEEGDETTLIIVLSCYRVAVAVAVATAAAAAVFFFLVSSLGIKKTLHFTLGFTSDIRC
jgi:hypothetical protein